MNEQTPTTTTTTATATAATTTTTTTKMAKNISIRFNASAMERSSSRSPSPMPITFDEIGCNDQDSLSQDIQPDATPSSDICEKSQPTLNIQCKDSPCSHLWSDAAEDYDFETDHVIGNVIDQLNRSHLDDPLNRITPIRPTAIQLKTVDSLNVYDGEQIALLTTNKTSNGVSNETDVVSFYQADNSSVVNTTDNLKETASVFNFKKKKNTATVGSKMDKFVRQLQESFTTATTISQTKSESSSPTTIKRLVKANDQINENNLVTEFADVFALPVEGNMSNSSLSNSVNNLNSNPKASSPSPTSNISWFNDMKFFSGNSLRERLRSDKNKANEERNQANNALVDNNLENHQIGGKCVTPGSSIIITTTISNNNNNTTTTTSNNNNNNNNNNGSSSSGSNSSLSTLSNGQATRANQVDMVSSISNNNRRTPTPPNGYIHEEALPIDDNTTASKKDKDTKELKKGKLTLSTAVNATTTWKKSKDESKNNNLKVKPAKALCTSPTATSLANLLSIITPANKQSTISNTTEVTQLSLQYSSSESLPSIVATSNDSNNMKFNKTSKLPVSKSMVSFRKTKNGNEEVSIEENFQSVFHPTINSSTNPTLRRKTISDINFKGNNNLSTSSIELPRHQQDSFSTSSTSSVITEDVGEFLSRESKENPFIIEQDENESPTSTQKLNSMLKGLGKHKPSDYHFTFIFYIFTLIVALISILLSLISPLPKFINGLILGFVGTFLLLLVIIVYITSKFILIKSDSLDEAVRRPGTPDSVTLRRSKFRKITFSPSNSNLLAIDNGAFSGWVSEFIGEYEERETDGFKSHLIFMILHGSIIYLLTPKEKMTEKKLKQFMLDSKSNNHISYSSYRTIDFSKLGFKRVTLFLTKNVRNQRKYIWSKKYPICIEFSDDRKEYNNAGGYAIHFSSSYGTDDYLNSTIDAKQKNPMASSPKTIKLVMFARTCREKEEWFWAIKNAIDSSMVGSLKTLSSLSESNRSVSVNDLPNFSYNESESSASNGQNKYLNILTRRLDYHNFLKSNVMNIDGLSGSGMMTPLTWFNVLLNRLSFDILNKPNWSAYIAKKLQRKLKKLRLPYFMENLVITEIDIGNALPKFNSVPTTPVVDEAGLWIDFDVSYSGGFTMTLETRVNLKKIKGLDGMESPPENVPPKEITPTVEPSTPLINGRPWIGYKCRSHTMVESNSNLNEVCLDSDSDLDSIVTSSEDEEPETAPADPDDADTDFKQKKFTRVVDRIAANQYFQKVSQMNFIRKALEGFSKISIILTVQLNSLNGTLAINIPESPSDRLWYGFRNDPQIQITARPKLGDHDVNVNYVTNLIEKKLKSEFFNYFVIPNMDDLFIPALNANIEPNICVVP